MKRRCILLIGFLSLLRSTSHATAMTIKLGVATKPGSAQNIVADTFKNPTKTVPRVI